jgi:leucyl aminopeptidase
MRVRLRRQAGRRVRAIALPVRQDADLPPSLRRVAVAEGFSGARGSTCLVYAPPGQVLLLGLGSEPDEAAAREAGARAAHRFADTERIALDARGFDAALAAAMAEGACLRAWHGGQIRSLPEEDAPALAGLDLLVDDPEQAAPAWRLREVAVEGTNFARNLVAAPANLLTPKTFVDRLAPLIAAGVEMTALKRSALRHLGLGGLLAVGSGSKHRPRLVVLHWAGTIPNRPPIAFVGKGITFDTGGISIKPAQGMEAMRADMAGAAACAGTLLALALRRSPAPALAVLALAENSTGAASYRPGDVIRSYSGRTVQIVDTDAEGRIVLADAIAFAIERYAPRAVVDLATLTGSIVTALGHEQAGLFGNAPALAAHLAGAGAAVGEMLWEMPIGASHREDLDSDIADLRQCREGRLQPDACHAAAFLREFAGATDWAHLDIAGVEAKAEADETAAAGPTGFGVRLLDRLVALRFEDPEE